MPPAPTLLSSVLRAAMAGRIGLVLSLATFVAPGLVAQGGANTLAQDVDRVESVRAIKRLQYAYAHLIADARWSEAAALFAPDGHLVETGIEEASGRVAIEAHLRDTIGQGKTSLPPRTIHFRMFMSPLVTLGSNGQSARGRWHVIGMDGQFGGPARWSGGIVENDYIRDGGVWRIACQTYQPFLTGDYANGWHSPGPTLPMMPYRHDPAEVGKPVTLPLISRRRSGAGRGVAARASALLAEDKVRNLQNAFGYYLDRKMWDDVADLFATGAVLSVEGIGEYRGPAGVRRWLARTGPAGLRYGELNDHIQTDVVVAIAADGRHARARGFDLGMVGRNDGKATWSVDAFDNLYVEEGGVWRIAQMRIAPRMKTDYAQGWGKSRIIDPAPAAAFAPDVRGSAPLPPAWPLTAAPKYAGPPHSGDVAAMIRSAAAYDAIENLSAAYGQYVDDNQWEALGSIFAREGERDSAGGGFIRTPGRIASFSRSRYGPYNPQRGFASLHIRTQPVIDVSDDGRSAQERSRLFQFLITRADAPLGKYESGMLMTGMYEDDVVFEDGAWKFKRVDIDHLLYTLDYRHGWTRIPEGTGKLLDPSLESVKDVKFDAPGAGDTYPPFPKVGHMWFHYRNPVSGRKPDYLMPKYDLPEP